VKTGIIIVLVLGLVPFEILLLKKFIPSKF
jgi:hypothetical protein